MTTENILAEQLAKIMNEKNLTLQNIADMSDIPIETIKNLFYSRTKNPRVNTITALANALNVSVLALLNGEAPDDEAAFIDQYRECSEYSKRLIQLITQFENIDSKKTLPTAGTQREIPCLVLEDTSNNSDDFLAASNIIADIKKISVSNRRAIISVLLPSDKYTPKYCKGDIILLENRFPSNGETVFFFYEGLLYFRHFHQTRSGYIFTPILGRGEDLFIKNISTISLIGTSVGILRK